MVKANVVIVGGGGAGCGVARELSAKLDSSRFNLILISLTEAFVYPPALLRMTVNHPDSPSIERDAVIPYTSLFAKGNGTVKVGKVVHIERNPGKTTGGTVTLETAKGSEELQFSYLVLATGSLWEGPLAHLNNRELSLKESLASWRGKFEGAKDIVLVGGGSVGLELAGELRDVYPSKNITIVHNQDLPLNDRYPAKFRKDVLKRWRDDPERNINFVFEDKIEDIPVDGIPSDGATIVKTKKGKTIMADLVVSTIGGRANTEFISSSLGEDVVERDTRRVKILPTLQLVAFPEIFAAGDITNYEETKQLAKYPGHAATVSANILSLINNQAPKAQYKGAMEGIFVTNGKSKGAGFAQLLWGLTFGNTIVGAIKSKGLLIPMARKGMGIKQA